MGIEAGNYVSYTDLMSSIDIETGDIVNVSSDILRLICVCQENGERFDPDTFIDSILEKVGTAGCVLFPTYFLGFCGGETFDYEKTRTKMGALGNVALARPDFRRTRHAMYSFAVWGCDQDYLCSLDNVEAFGVDSPFGYLYQKRAKNLFIGIDYKYAYTSVHYAEERVGVSYRYSKEFRSWYVDENGVEESRAYRMYARDMSAARRTLIDPRMDDVLLGRGYYRKYSINGIYLGLIDLHGTGDVMMEDLRGECTLVYPQRPEIGRC